MPTRICFVRWGITLLLFCGCALAWAQRVPSPDDPKAVVAETQQIAKRQGMLRTGRIVWKCADKLCIATSRRLAVGVNTCQALAELVGSLSRFGRVERPIPSYDLALCNVRAQIKLAKLEQQRADAEMARARRLSPRAPLVEDLPAPTTDASSSVANGVAGSTAARPGGGSSRLSGPKPLPRGTLPGSPDTAPAANPQIAAANSQGAAPSAQSAAPNTQGAAPNAQSAAPNAQGAAPNARGAAPNARGAAPNPQRAAANAQRPSANAQRAAVTAAGGSATARQPPPVVETSPIAPSYRPSIYALRVTPLAVVGRGSSATDVPSPPSEEAPANEPEWTSSSDAASSATSASPRASASPAEEASVTSIPGAASSPDALALSADTRRPAATTAATYGAPGSAQTSLRSDASADAVEQLLPGSAQAPSGVAPSARAVSAAPVAVSGLAIVGHGRMKEPVQGTHLTVTVDRLEVIGKREGNE